MAVRVTNYLLPITFNYKGWIVTINDGSSLFQFSDVRVNVRIEINRALYTSSIVNAIMPQAPLYQKSSYFLEKLKLYNRISEVVADFFNTKKPIEYIEKANGGMLDRFLGQNISGIEKIQQKIRTYIDTNLGSADFKKELIDYLKQIDL